MPAEKRYEELNKQANERGYFLNPDMELTMNLVEGLVTNKQRYGEEICPCRLMKGTMEDNLDIICPCDYRDQDLAEYGSCFCGLYVSEAITQNGGAVKQTPERRPPLEERKAKKADLGNISSAGTLAYPIWRCKVCGYLCANPHPPLICPICKVKQERFERIF
jgi:ferredoxin-thioredoxin reductase catalytic subunit/rubredoxin